MKPLPNGHPSFPLPHHSPSHQQSLLPSSQLEGANCRCRPASSAAANNASQPAHRPPSGLACVVWVSVVLLWSVHVLLEDQPLLLLHGFSSSLLRPDPLYRASWTAAPQPGLAELDHELLLPVHSNGTANNWTVLLLHGLGDHRGSDAFGLRDALLATRPDLFGAMRFVIPFAPTLPISVFEGGQRSAWFDIASWTDVHSSEDERNMKENARRLSSLIRKHAPDVGRTIVGGFSQGAVMSLLLGLTLDHPPAALLMLSGYVPLPTRLPSLIPLLPPQIRPSLHWLHGTLDPFLPIDLARVGFKSLKQLEYFQSIKFEEIQNLDHHWITDEVSKSVGTILDAVNNHHHPK